MNRLVRSASKLGSVARLGLVVLAAALLLTATTAAVAPRIWRIANAHDETPVELPPFAELSERTYVYDAVGQEIAVYEVQNTQPIDLDDVPEHVIAAFLAVEDNEFWGHHGVNVRSLFRAVLSNFATEGPIQGASTITMQVVKNDYMAGFERDGRYKLLQIVYAVRLEKERSKAEILERYLNTVFFGQNSYGIGAAAETYFGKPVPDLTFVEASFLAGLVQAPSTYDPITSPERSRGRFTQVLDRLESEGHFTEEERADIDDTFVLPERVRRRPETEVVRTYYTEALRDYLLNRSDILGATYEERYTRLHRGGLRIHTTLDPAIQAQAEEARNQLPGNLVGIDAAITSLDTRTGAIRAMVGGQGFIPGEREVNLALAPSQTGSSIKMFILAAALQAGATPNDLINALHPCVLPNPGDPREPTFTTRGGVSGAANDTVRAITVRSINCGFLRLAQVVGLNRMVDTVYRMAANPYLDRRSESADPLQRIMPYPSFATGANELSTLDMAAGIQTIANEGVHMRPYYVDYIDNVRGERVYTHHDPGEQVLSREAALTTIDVMKGVLTGGTARRELADFASRRPAFGKTGTQMSNWTAYFVGATPSLSTAVLVRDPDRYTSMSNIPEFLAAGVGNVQGGTFPARIWGAFMENVGLEQGVADWPAPPAPSRGPARLYLPGNECLFEIIGYTPASTVPPDAGPAGFAQPRAAPPEEPPPTAEPPAGEPAPPDTPPPPTAPPTPIYGPVPSGTTIPPDVLDPNAPLPSVAPSAVVLGCPPG
ncbi:MAG TPA: transglycosylase domain-containing protein [Ilumatobacter sp.]|nr:transglycosylase domain-containing protein [Ilumatobacter sp.]